MTKYQHSGGSKREESSMSRLHKMPYVHNNKKSSWRGYVPPLRSATVALHDEKVKTQSNIPRMYALWMNTASAKHDMSLSPWLHLKTKHAKLRILNRKLKITCSNQCVICCTELQWVPRRPLCASIRSSSICDLPDAINSQFREFAVEPSGPVHFLLPY